MKSKNTFLSIFVLLFILFITLYIGQASGYYKYEQSKKTTLTKDAIKRFEADVKDGKNLKASNYLEKEKNYSNKISKIGLKVSNMIESSFDKTMSYFFKQIDSEVNTKK